jgi:hypothetical protein
MRWRGVAYITLYPDADHRSVTAPERLGGFTVRRYLREAVN